MTVEKVSFGIMSLCELFTNCAKLFFFIFLISTNLLITFQIQMDALTQIIFQENILSNCIRVKDLVSHFKQHLICLSLLQPSAQNYLIELIFLKGNYSDLFRLQLFTNVRFTADASRVLSFDFVQRQSILLFVLLKPVC